MNLNTSDFLQLFGIMASLLTSIIAILVSVQALRQNSKLIEESNRPYISIYGEMLTFRHHRQFYIVVRNTGNSPAIITDLKYNFDFTDCYHVDDTDRNFLESIIDCPIGNGRSKICSLDYERITKPITFILKYKTYSGKSYEETYTVDLKAGSGLLIESADNKEAIKDISYSLQEFVRRNL